MSKFFLDFFNRQTNEIFLKVNPSFTLHLDRYWDSLQAAIWPRFELIFRMNIQSVRDCDPNKFNKSLAPHYVSLDQNSSLKNSPNILEFTSYV